MNRRDFEVDNSPPSSIREYVEDIVWSCALSPGSDKALEPGQSIDDLLKQVYRHIETEALKKFKSNELWAIRAWTYENILQDSVAKAAATTDSNLLDELISPIADWQKQEFDPISNLRRKLTVSGRTPGYIKECLRVATKLVSKYGKNQTYTEQQLLEFMEEEQRRYAHSSYVTRSRQLKAFLDSLPEDERGRRPKLPIAKIPAYPDEFHQPVFTNEEIDKLIYTAVMYARPDIVLRLAVATIYGTRVSEVAALSSKHINLNHEAPTISIPTQKKGRRVPQPIPTELVPLFSIPLETTKSYLANRQLKRLCKRAGVPIQYRMGHHSIRRAVVTVLHGSTDLKENEIFTFLRWSPGSRGFGHMHRYIKTPVELTDAKVLSKHPFVSMWLTMAEFLPYLPQYDSVYNINIIRTVV